MYTKKNGRMAYRSNRRSNYKRNINFSNGKTRNKGNVVQQYNKYLKMAKEAFAAGDRIQSEYYYQFTDHYYRLLQELGFNIDDNDLSENKSKDFSEEPSQNLNENKENIEANNIEASITTETDKKDDIESIESVSFIAEPSKKKSTKNKKTTA